MMEEKNIFSSAVDSALVCFWPSYKLAICAITNTTMKFVLVSPFSLCNKLKEALLNINKLFWGVKLITCDWLEIGNWNLEIENWRLKIGD